MELLQLINEYMRRWPAELPTLPLISKGAASTAHIENLTQEGCAAKQ